ncbi:hypothetical protein PIB30_104778, partial [Stylosanthes scabra]|nr:hypothetical protein [Stylosanthes scabra]
FGAQNLVEVGGLCEFSLSIAGPLSRRWQFQHSFGGGLSGFEAVCVHRPQLVGVLD